MPGSHYSHMRCLFKGYHSIRRSTSSTVMESTPLTFWSVAVILTVSILILVLFFLVLTDFCCEMHICFGSAPAEKPRSVYQSIRDIRWMSTNRLSKPPKPSAPPLESKDTEVTIVSDVDEHQWTSYLYFCQNLRTNRQQPVISIYSGSHHVEPSAPPCDHVVQSL